MELAAEKAAAEQAAAAEAAFAHHVDVVLRAPGAGNPDAPGVREAAEHIQACRGLGLSPLTTSRAQLAAVRAQLARGIPI